MQVEENNLSHVFNISVNLQENQRKNCMSDTFWVIKSTPQIVHAGTYIKLFLPGSNYRFLLSYFYFWFYYLFIFLFSFHPYFLRGCLHEISFKIKWNFFNWMSCQALITVYMTYPWQIMKTFAGVISLWSFWQKINVNTVVKMLCKHYSEMKSYGRIINRKKCFWLKEMSSNMK